jgi:hypothetical protein
MPSVALNERGGALAVWVQDGKTLAARREASGRWRPAGTIGLVAPSAVELTGARALVVTEAPNAGCAQAPCAWTIVVKSQRRAEDPWTDAVPPLSVASAASAPSVAMSRRGDVLVAWSTGNPPTVRAVRLLAGAPAFKPEQTIAAPGISSLAINARGDAVIGWIESDGRLVGRSPTPGIAHVWATLRSAVSKTWSSAEAITDVATRPEIEDTLGVGIDLNGNVAAAWTAASAGSTGSASNLVPSLGAAFRPASTGKWNLSPDLQRGSDIDTSFYLRGVGVAQGAAWVRWGGIYGPGDYSTGVYTRDPSTGMWSDKHFSSTYGLNQGMQAFAAAPNGCLLAVWSGMWVAEFDDAITPPPPKAVPRAVLRSGRRFVLRFTLARAGRIYARIVARKSGRLVRRITPAKPFAAGKRQLEFARLSRGSYIIEMTACDARAGCDLGPPRGLPFSVR